MSICRNVQTGIRSTSRDFYYELAGGYIIPNGKEITTKCHFIAKKIQEDIIREALQIYNNKMYN